MKIGKTAGLFDIEEDEDTMVVTFKNDAITVMNMLLPWNLGSPVFRKVFKRDIKTGAMKEHSCEFTEKMEQKLAGKGLPSWEEQKHL